MGAQAAELASLASHLRTRRATILKAWRSAVDADPDLTTPSSLPRTQFYDHIPAILDDLAHRLGEPGSSSMTAARHDDAAAHGLQRWQQGYDLREVIREWGHLQLCLGAELDAYEQGHPGVSRDTMAAARRALTELSNRGVGDSTAKYFELREQEAEGTVRDLEQALAHARSLQQRRTALWQEAAHDLRGNLGVVANAAAGLSMETLPPSSREKFFRLLQQSVSSLSAMLNDVTDLSRLHAGHERLEIDSFDAAAVLRELCENLEGEASSRGLYLHGEGASALHVNGDAVKVRRIAQNLLLNALKYTDSGGVTVRWGASRENDPARWTFSIEDTGPGFHAGPGAPVAGALEEATDEAHEVERQSERANAPKSERAADKTTPAPDTRPVRQESGEGIGLSIVKRLCELLGASMEMESAAEVGTIVRVFVPRDYPQAARNEVVF